jgi:hypothetical protein
MNVRIALATGGMVMGNGMLLGMWNEDDEVLTIRRANGQVYKVKGGPITSGGHQVFGVETVGNEIHVLTGPTNNQRPNRRVRFGDSGSYKGSRGL